MKTTTTALSLLEGLRRLRPANKDPWFDWPVVRVVSHDNRLMLSASGRNIAIDTVVACQSDNNGRIVLPFAPIFALLDRCGQSEVELRLLPTGEVKISSSDLTANLRQTEIDKWPKMTMDASKLAVLKDVEAQRLMVVAGAASKDPQRPILNGVHLAHGIADCTDTFRAVRSKIPVWNDHVILPLQAIEAAELAATLAVSFDGTLVELQSARTTIRSATISGKFPDLNRFFEEPVIGSLTMDRIEFIESVKSAAALEPSSVAIQLKGNKVHISSESSEFGTVETTAEGQGSLTNTHYFTGESLLATLQCSTDDIINLEFTARDYFLARCSEFEQLLMVRKLDFS